MTSRSHSSSPGIRRRSSLHESDDKPASSTLPPPSLTLSTSSLSTLSSSTPSSSTQPTPLPSIRSLHPYLPPANTPHPSLRDLHSHGLPGNRDTPRPPPPPTMIVPSFSGGYASASAASPYSPYSSHPSHSPRIHPPPQLSPHLAGVAGPGPMRSLSGSAGGSGFGVLGSGSGHVGGSLSHGGAGGGSTIPPSSTFIPSYSASAGSDGEDVAMEGSGMGMEHSVHAEQPNKKKRRRQALSCTECKRRKIKCDRTQPCTPCTRRGEQAKCQWHVVESSNDKYVSRAEYDELKGRVDKLEALIARLTGAGSSSLSFEGYGRDDGGERSGGRSPDTGYGGMAAANMGRQRRGDGREEGGGESGVGSSRISGVGLAEATSAYGGYRGIGNEGRFPVAQSHGLDHQSPIGSRRSSSGGTSGSTVSGSGAGIGRLRSVSGIEDGGNPREASRVSRHSPSRFS